VTRAGPAALLATLATLAPATAAAAPPRLDVDRSGPQPVIADAEGRQVTLRGINVNQLGDYFQADPQQPVTFPLTAGDFADIARLGFDHVRLVLNWSALEPSRGAFDAGYLERIRAAVRQAEDHGLRVVLDMHQDAWGKTIATPPGETCPPGLGPAVGWDGAPAWATFTDGLTTCRAADTRELSPAVAQAFQSFYLDRDGIQTALVQTWAKLAAAFAGDTNVIGYDLLNEPHPGFLAGADQSAALGRYYAAAIEAIRAAETRAGGFPHLVFFEPSVVWSGFGTDATPPPGFTSDERIVFAPHLYAESITVDQKLGISSVSIEQGFDAAEQAAERYDAPLWVGEWGWFGDPAKERPKMDRFNRQEDERLIAGSAFWVWKQACGDPHTVGYSGAAGALNRLDCPGDKPLGLATPFTEALGRAYPRAAPGRLTQLQSDAAARRFALRGSDPVTSGSCELEVWFPGDAEPALAGTNVAGLRTRRVDGGWLVTACARGDYALSGRPGERAPAAARESCRSKRVIRMTARRPRGGVRRVRVRASLGKLRIRGRRITLDLRGRPRARVVVVITVIARDGSRHVDRRAYRTCTPGRRG
jgi:endoglycosylceramidase